MKKNATDVKTTKKVSPSRRSKADGGKRNKRKDFFKDVLGFRWLKKAMVGKTQEESLDLLDQWILKKRALTLFF